MKADDFFNMEIKYRLFDLKVNDAEPIWDIIRFHIFYRYTWPTEITVTKSKYKRFKEIIKNLWIAISSISSLFLRKADNIVVSTSRYLDKESRLFDKASYDVIKALGENALVIESRIQSGEYCFHSEFNFVSYYSRFKRNNQKLPVEIYLQIEQALIACFGDKKITYDELNALYRSFLNEYRYYRFLFRLKKAKRLFLVQNGIQKGMIAAALDSNMQVFELQHGSINREHMAYSYPPNMCRNKNIIFPHFFLTLGKYWGANMNIPALQVIPLGNNCFVPDNAPVERDGSILFISSMIHGHDLINVAISFAKKHPEIKICFKLHTNEYPNEGAYLSSFKEYTNITLVKGEMDLNTLIKRSSLVILIASTVLYEALNLNHKVAIYKRVNYYTQQDCFGLPNVFLFDSIEELEGVLKIPEQAQKNMFFASFQKELLTNLYAFN